MIPCRPIASAAPETRKTAIDQEVARAKQLLALGGFFPMVDHSIPPDVPLEAFEYLLASLRS